MPYRYEKLSLKAVKRLPIGLPFQGKIYTNFKVKGLTTELLLNLHKKLGNRPDVEVSEVINDILRNSLLELGPYKAPFDESTFSRVQRTITSVDREFLAWMVVLENSRHKRDYANRDVEFFCDCNNQKWSGVINGWDLDCILVDPSIWKLHDEALAYTIEFEGERVDLIVANGGVEESLSGTDTYEKTFKYLSQVVLAIGDKKLPFKGDGLAQGDPHYQFKLFQAIMPSPLPGVDSRAFDYCEKCKKKSVVGVTFIPFLYGSFEPRSFSGDEKETLFTML